MSPNPFRSMPMLPYTAAQQEQQQQATAYTNKLGKSMNLNLKDSNNTQAIAATTILRGTVDAHKVNQSSTKLLKPNDTTLIVSRVPSSEPLEDGRDENSTPASSERRRQTKQNKQQQSAVLEDKKKTKTKKVPAYLRSVSTMTRKPISQIMDFIMDEEWESVQDLLNVNPSLTLVLDDEENIETGRKGYHMVCQGETSKCTLIHVIIQRCPTSVPLALLEQIVKINPTILSKKDMKLGMLPLHLALFKGCSEYIIEFLIQRYPLACQIPDGQENLPLHYAAIFSTTLGDCCDPIVSEIVDDKSNTTTSATTKVSTPSSPSLSSFLMVLQAYPQACSTCNGKERYPLHLLISRAYNHDLLCLNDVMACIDEHPECLEIPDRCGRLPLHLACRQGQLRWDILNLLIQKYPTGLLAKDMTGKIPYQLAKKQKCYNSGIDDSGCHDNEVVLQSLSECTKRERLKSGKGNNFLRSFSSPRILKKKKKVCTAQIDLYNCYG